MLGHLGGRGGGGASRVWPVCFTVGALAYVDGHFTSQFDHDWFSEGTLPSLPRGPKFAGTKSMKRTHEIAGELYKLRKMMHSSKVKLQAAR